MMNKAIRLLLTGLLLIIICWSCGTKDPQPNLPDYLLVPSSLSGYLGSGQVIIQGSNGLNLSAEGQERLNSNTKTYSGVSGSVSGDDIQAGFTFGQPQPYEESNQVPNVYKANGRLVIFNSLTPGTYTMNAQAPGPRGEFADLTLELTGPQLYISRDGTLTIDDVSLIKTEGGKRLYRVTGSFQNTMQASGVGIVPSAPAPVVTGSFDFLFVNN